MPVGVFCHRFFNIIFKKPPHFFFSTCQKNKVKFDDPPIRLRDGKKKFQKKCTFFQFSGLKWNLNLIEKFKVQWQKSYKPSIFRAKMNFEFDWKFLKFSDKNFTNPHFQGKNEFWIWLKIFKIQLQKIYKPQFSGLKWILNLIEIF